MFALIAIVLVVLVAAVLVIATTKPDTFTVQRATSIAAPREKIFPLIDDFRAWASWSPYEKMDPAMKKSLGGAASGKGAVYEWEGNNKVGKGRMEIAEVAPPSRIIVNMDFDRPMKASHIAEFTLEPNGPSTIVSWAMHGRNVYMTKVMGTFIDMDNLIGRDFETGLANLKAIAER
jgi:uncharacterized protein YndB with AHSA1/START domain